MKHTKQWTFLAALACAAVTAAAAAAQDGGPPPDGQRRGPPPEAIAACKGKAEGAKVEFTGRRGEKVKGVCKKMRDVMAAVPEGGPPPPRDQNK